MTIHSFRQSIFVSALALVAALAGGCTVQEQEIPGLIGPSELGLSIGVTAAPQVLPRDGSSTSRITMTARNADGSPRPQQRLQLLVDAGTLSAADVTTGTDGTASVVYIAPGLNENVSTVTIRVVPIEAGDLANTNTRTVQIAVLGPSIPVAVFTAPSPVTAGVPVTFDGSQSTLDGAACSNCTFVWEFGDGNSATGMAVQYTYSSAGVRTARLTVTSPTGTSNSTTRTVTISMPDAPVADFTVTPDPPVVNQASIFSGAGSTVGVGATITQYVWDFGDGTTATTTTPIASKTYNAAGAVGVTLTVTDSLGRTNTVARTITVAP